MKNEVEWIYDKEGETEFRTCPICHMCQIKKDGDWVFYLTMKGIAKCFDNIFLDIKNDCYH